MKSMAMPLNAETLVHMLDDFVTPTDRHFVRNNGIPPTNVDANEWVLTIKVAANRLRWLSLRRNLLSHSDYCEIRQ